MNSLLADESLAATRRGTRLRATSDSDSDILLKFTVEDSGIGIAPQEQKRIFDPFTQADASMTRHFGGSGLGLAIASGLVKLMGGRIWVESQPGQGSTFSFTVRLKRRPPSTKGLTAVLARRDRLHGLPILLVAENPTVRRVLQLMLFRWGMKPETMANVPAALVAIKEAAASGQAFSLALVDAALPGTDGYVLAEWIKDNPQMVGTTILMFSPCDRVAHVRRCQELGVRYLEKPISQSNLLNLISQTTRFAGHVPRRLTPKLRKTSNRWLSRGRCGFSSSKTISPIRNWPCIFSKNSDKTRRWPAMAAKPWNACAKKISTSC